MQLKKSFAIAMILSIIGIASWEAYWRSQDYYPTLNDEKALWAIHRAKVESSTQDHLVHILTFNLMNGKQQLVLSQFNYP